MKKNTMPTVYIACYEWGRKVLKVTPKWECRPIGNHGSFIIDGTIYNERALFKSEKAAWADWDKEYVPKSDRFSIQELEKLWKENE